MTRVTLGDLNEMEFTLVIFVNPVRFMAFDPAWFLPF